MRVVGAEELRHWEDNGATWRALDVSDEHAVVELCTCYGEPVDRLQTEAPDVIEYVRARGSD